jgi:hypothetical protein
MPEKKRSPAHYIVRWEMDVYEDDVRWERGLKATAPVTLRDIAQVALDLLVEPNGTARVFEVIDDDNIAVPVDLNQD